jgi:hypothetical protein
MTTDNDFTERRKCSDNECKEARQEWFKESLLPQLRAEFAKLIIACVLTLGGVFMFLNRSAITSHELSDTRTYVSIPQHSVDMARIETQMQELKVEFRAASKDIIERLDRNYSDPLRKKQ